MPANATKTVGGAFGARSFLRGTVKFTVALDRTVGQAVYRVHLQLYQLTGGRVGHQTPVRPVLVLTTLGRHTRQRRSVPLLYFVRDMSYFVVSSSGG